MAHTRQAPALPQAADSTARRAPPGTGLAVAVLCTLAALGGCATGYGVGVVIGTGMEGIEK